MSEAVAKMGFMQQLKAFLKDWMEWRPISGARVAAMLAVMIGHTGHFFFPGEPWWRIVGRIAMPVFVYELTRGIQRTKNFPAYVMRVSLIALISQPVFMMMDPTRLNICFTLAYTMVVLWVSLQMNTVGKVVWLLAALLFTHPQLDGARFLVAIGIILTYVNQPVLKIGLLCLATVKAAHGSGWWVNYFYALAIPVVYLSEKFKIRFNAPRYISYLFYPFHWSFFILLLMILGKPILVYDPAAAMFKGH